MPSDTIPEIGEAQLGIELKRAFDEPPRFIQAPRARIACGGDAETAQKMRLFLGHLFRQRPSLLIAAGIKMSNRGKVLHKDHQGIERAEPHGTRQVLDPEVRIAKTGFKQTA